MLLLNIQIILSSKKIQLLQKLLFNIQIILSSKKIQLLQKLLFNNVIVKESVNKKMIRNSVCALPQEIVIPLPVSIFFSQILYVNSQIVGLPEILRKIFLTK